MAAAAGAAAVAVPTELSVAEVRRRWAPLAAGWLFMTLELVVAAAVIARLPDPEVQLAAWGVVFAIATLIQAPATALLPVSTSLVRDRSSFRRMRLLSANVLFGLSMLHLLIALPPANGWLLEGVLGLPAGVAEAARWPLLLMLPWAFGTGYRRFLHGPMIRFGYGSVVIQGTLIRLGIGLLLLLGGPLLAPSLGLEVPGAALAAFAIIVAVLSELLFTALRSRAVVRRSLGEVEQIDPAELALRRFMRLYFPLVMTTWLTMLVQLLVSASLGRMPLPLASLAVWPVVYGFLILWQGPGLAFTEVVIALVDRPNAWRMLLRFTRSLMLVLTLAMVGVVASPAYLGWFAWVMGLEGEPLSLARLTLLGLVLVPALRMWASLYQGVLIARSRTGAVWASVVAFAAVVGATLLAGVVGLFGGLPGAYVGAIATTLGMSAQGAVLVWALRSAGSAAGPPAGSAALAREDFRRVL